MTPELCCEAMVGWGGHVELQGLLIARGDLLDGPCEDRKTLNYTEHSPAGVLQPVRGLVGPCLRGLGKPWFTRNCLRGRSQGVGEIMKVHLRSPGLLADDVDQMSEHPCLIWR